MDGGGVHDCSDDLPGHSDPNSFDLHGSAAESDDVDPARRPASASSASATPVQTQVVHIKPQVHLMDAGKLMQPKVIPKDIKESSRKTRQT